MLLTAYVLEVDMRRSFLPSNGEQLREAYKLANEREKASFFPTTGGVSEHKSVIPLDYQSKQRFAGTHFKDYCAANSGTVDEWVGLFGDNNYGGNFNRTKLQKEVEVQRGAQYAQESGRAEQPNTIEVADAAPVTQEQQTEA